MFATADDDSQGTVSDCVFSVDEEEVVQDAEVASRALMYGDVVGGVAADEIAAEALGLGG